MSSVFFDERFRKQILFLEIENIQIYFQSNIIIFVIFSYLYKIQIIL